MTHEDHRVYSYLSEPLRFYGLTSDEIILSGVGFFTCLIADTNTMKLIGVVGGAGGVYLLKRFKRINQGFSLRSFLHWHLGIRRGLPKDWPQSAYKWWLP